MNVTVVAALGVVVVAGGGGGVATREEARALSVDPAASPIEHVVVVMTENRSFDHLLGWLDGADGRQAALATRFGWPIGHTSHASIAALLRQVSGTRP